MKSSRLVVALSLSLAFAAPAFAATSLTGLWQGLADRAAAAGAKIAVPVVLSPDQAEMALKCYFHWSDACTEAFAAEE
jgi:hypothetical protein